MELMQMEKKFKVKLAFGMYSVGAIISPTGVYRSDLLRKGFIEPYTEPAPVPKVEPVKEAPKPVVKPVTRVDAAPEAAVMPPVETAAAPAPIRRGRPPKHRED
jgi:hypothetical protein